MIRFIDMFPRNSSPAKRWSMLSPCWVLGGIIIGQSVCAQTDRDKETEGTKIYVAETFSYDSNIYHVATGTELPTDQLGEEATREDTVNQLSAGMDGNWLFARQALGLSLRVDDNQYTDNKELDHVSGHGELDWAWVLGGNLSGELGAEYKRALASFTGNRVLTKDLVDTRAYFGEAAIAIGSRWTLRSGVRRTQASHSSVDREVDDYRGNSGNMAIEYQTKAGDLVGLNYRYAESRFADTEASVASTDRAYDESTTSLRFKHAFTVKTALEGNAGYLRRTYTDPANQGFSGNVWHLTLQWQPRTKTQINASAWRELRAYQDAESDYFVSMGGAVEPSWRPTVKLKLALRYAYEDQEFLGSGFLESAAVARQDRVTTGQMSIGYAPIELLQFTLSGRREQRHSNRPSLGYGDDLASLELRLVF